MGRYARALLLVFLFQTTAIAQYTISTFAGNGRSAFLGDGGPAAQSGVAVSGVTGVAVDHSGNVYLGDGNGRIRKVDPTGIITTYAGGGSHAVATGVAATDASIGGPECVSVDDKGNVYFARPTAFQIDPTGILNEIPGIGINFVGGLATDSAGNLYVSDSDLNGIHRVLKVTPAGLVTPFAGTGSRGYSGDNGPAISAQLNQPNGLAVDSAGNVYIADTANERIRKVDTNGIITTIAGNGKNDYPGDGRAATSASFNDPVGIALDSAGNLYIADRRNDVIRMVARSSGIITTIAGIGGTDGESGDGGLALNAQLSFPTGIAVDAVGRVYIGDTGNVRVRVLTPVQASPGTLTTLSPASAALGGAALTLTVNGSSFASGATVRWNGTPLTTTFVSSNQLSASVPANILGVAGGASISVRNPGAIASNSVNFVVNPPATTSAPTYTISVFAGTGLTDFSGDGGPATQAGLTVSGEASIALGRGGSVYIGDGHSRLRRVDAAGIITTFAGGGTRSAATGIPATSAGGLAPDCVAVDGSDNVYFARPTAFQIDTMGNLNEVAPAPGSISAAGWL